MRAVGNIDWNGKEDGAWVYYYPSGATKKEGDFIAGTRDGEWKYYDEKGKEIKPKK